MLEALQDRARDQMVALLESVDSSVLMEQVQVSSTSDGFGRWSNHPKQKLVDRPEQPRNDPNGTEQTDAIAATSRQDTSLGMRKEAEAMQETIITSQGTGNRVCLVVVSTTADADGFCDGAGQNTSSQDNGDTAESDSHYEKPVEVSSPPPTRQVDVPCVHPETDATTHSTVPDASVSASPASAASVRGSFVSEDPASQRQDSLAATKSGVGCDSLSVKSATPPRAAASATTDGAIAAARGKPMPPTASAASTPLATSSKSTARVRRQSGGASTAVVDEEIGLSVEGLDALADSLFSQTTRSKLKSTKWAERLEGMLEVMASVESSGEILEQPSLEATCRLLHRVLASDKETNFQVMAKGFNIVQALSFTAADFSARAARWFIPLLIEKLGDAKLRHPASECLLSLAEACRPGGPIYVVAQVVQVLQTHKAPKVLEHGTLWLATFFDDFGVALVPPTSVVPYTKGMLQEANPAVRKAAIQLLARLRGALGEEVLKTMLSDLRPSLISTIDDTLRTIEDKWSAPKRRVRGHGDEACAAVSVIAGSSIVTDGGGDNGGQAIEMPTRLDLGSQTLISRHQEAMCAPNWKARQEAIAALDDVVSKAKPPANAPHKQGYIKVTGAELWKSLRARLQDSNKNILVQVLALLGKIAEAMGPDADKHAKHVLPSMLALTSDSKRAVCDALMACLRCWAKNVASETMIKHLPVALSVELPAGREAALTFATEYLATRSACNVADLSPIVMPVMDGLLFRTPEVRVCAAHPLSRCSAGGKICNKR